MMISFRTESGAMRCIAAEQNIRAFRPISAAMSACRNWRLCPCLPALDCWRITGNAEFNGSSVSLRGCRLFGSGSFPLHFSVQAGVIQLLAIQRTVEGVRFSVQIALDAMVFRWWRKAGAGWKPALRNKTVRAISEDGPYMGAVSGSVGLCGLEYRS